MSVVLSEGFAMHIGAGCVWQHKVCQASLPLGHGKPRVRQPPVK
jgi:hypothetical protein